MLGTELSQSALKRPHNFPADRIGDFSPKPFISAHLLLSTIGSGQETGIVRSHHSDFPLHSTFSCPFCLPPSPILSSHVQLFKFEATLSYNGTDVWR